MAPRDFKERNKYKKGTCIDCQERFHGCSANCEKKKAFDEERRKMKAYINQDHEAGCYVRDTTERLFPWKKKQR